MSYKLVSRHDTCVTLCVGATIQAPVQLFICPLAEHRLPSHRCSCQGHLIPRSCGNDIGSSLRLGELSRVLRKYAGHRGSHQLLSTRRLS